MLINNSNTFKSRDVIVLKFMNGEEALATFKTYDQPSGKYTVTKPVVMQLVPVGNGQGAVQFAPFMLGRDDSEDYVINENRLMVDPALAREDAAKQYLKATSSIELVDAGSFKL